MRVNPSGRPCRCGAVGCWETEVGVEALVDSAAGCGLDGVTALDVLEAARAGDPAALRAVNEVSTWLGVGLVNLLHVLNPQAVVLGGHLAAIHGAAPEAVTNQLTQALPAAREQVVIVPAALGGDAVLIGGAEVAFEELLGDPAGRAARFSAQPAVTSAG